MRLTPFALAISSRPILLRRPPAQRLSFTPPAPAMATAPVFSKNSDDAALERDLGPLLASSGAGGRWALAADGEGLERTFKFKTFAKTWDFMTAVSLQCKIKNHHPEWSNVYNATFVRWTTHNPKGLSHLDVSMAVLCDEIAQVLGEVEAEAETSCNMKGLLDSATAAAGDCCGPPPK